jgi:hypothetical protein
MVLAAQQFLLKHSLSESAVFRRLNPQQQLFQPLIVLPSEWKKKLENSWAEVFRKEALSLIPEDEFAHLYDRDTGRPNFPVALLVALSIIKELLGLTDAGLLHAFHFDLVVLHALGLEVGQRSLAPRTLYYFRDRVAGDPALMATFRVLTQAILDRLGLRTDVQRLDSTQISSNMVHLSRLGLFVRTLESFLETARKVLPEAVEALPAVIRDRYLNRAGYFADTTGADSRRRLEQCAQDLAALLDHFEPYEPVRTLEGYGLLRRLFDEQCRVEVAEGEMIAVLKDPSEIASTSLQSPSDPDATYSGHKGKGYQVQIAETSHEDNPVEIITYVAVEGAHEDDHAALIPYIEQTQADGIGPQQVLADTAYSSGPNLVEAAERGVELLAPTPGTVDPDDLTLADFSMDLETGEITHCPEGHAPERQQPTRNGKGMIVRFDRATCAACEFADSCPAGKAKGRLRFLDEQLALAWSRAREQTPEFKTFYKRRGGIESTNAELKTGHGMRKVWTRGKERVTFAVVMKVLAVNLKRFARVRCAPQPRQPAEDAALGVAEALCWAC